MPAALHLVMPAALPVALRQPLAERFCPLALEAVPAGFPSPADDYVEARIDLNRELIPSPLSTYLMRVRGDAMAGDGIMDGDLLVIDRSLAPRPGRLVVALEAGAFIHRRLRCGAGGFRLEASDGCTPPVPLEQAELWGVVIHAIHHLVAVPTGQP
jgi:DNA polymerase V